MVKSGPIWPIISAQNTKFKKDTDSNRQNVSFPLRHYKLNSIQWAKQKHESIFKLIGNENWQPDDDQ